MVLRHKLTSHLVLKQFLRLEFRAKSSGFQGMEHYTKLSPTAGLSMLYSYVNKEIIQARTNTLLERGMLVCLFSHIAVFTLLLIRRARGFADVTEVR